MFNVEDCTVEQLAAEIKVAPDALIGILDKLGMKNATPTSKVSSAIAKKALKISGARVEVLQQSLPPGSELATVDDLEAINKEQVKAIAHTCKVSQTLVKQLDKARRQHSEREDEARRQQREREIELLFYESLHQADLEFQVETAARSAVAMQRLDEKEQELQRRAEELAKSHLENDPYAIALKFGLNVKDLEDKLKTGCEERITLEQKRLEWIEKAKRGEPLPEEAKHDFLLIVHLKSLGLVPTWV